MTAVCDRTGRLSLRMLGQRDDINGGLCAATEGGMGLLELLQAGDVAAFNEARADEAEVVFFAEELDGLTLVGIDLSHAKLEKSDLTGTDLSEATLTRADMREIDGSELKLARAMMLGARLADAFLEDADLTGADVSHADLSGATLTHSAGAGLVGRNARFRDISAHGATWPQADLSEANLARADLTHATLSGAVLTKAQATQCVLEHAELDGVQAAGIRLGGARLAKANLKGAVLTGAQLAGADLSGADLSGANLTRANLTDANLTGARLTGACMVDAVLDGANLTDADLSDADLSGLDPTALDLDASQVEELAGAGARFDPDAAFVYDDASVALHGSHTAVLWMNPDSLDSPTLRWLVSDGSMNRWGVLAVAGAAVMAHAVVDSPQGFTLLAMVERADGVQLIHWSLSTEGDVSSPRAQPLGYDPAVLPVVRSEGGQVWIWGLERRGPSVVLQRGPDDSGAFTPVLHEVKSTARGFFGRGHPVLMCKGGVVLPVRGSVIADPVRTPEGFPTRIATVVANDAGVLAVWGVEPTRRDPGGLRTMWLGARQAVEPGTLTRLPDLHSLDGVPVGDAVMLAWADEVEPGTSRVGLALLRESGQDEVGEVPFGYPDPDDVRIVCRDGKPEAVAVNTLSGRLVVVRLDGEVIVDLDDAVGFDAPY